MRAAPDKYLLVRQTPTLFSYSIFILINSFRINTSELVLKVICYHFQGAWGTSVMLSKKHKHLASGIERFVQPFNKLIPL